MYCSQTRKICIYLLKPYDFCLIDFLEQLKFRFESSFIVNKTKQHPKEKMRRDFLRSIRSPEIVL